MTYETKVILEAMADIASKAESVKEVYVSIAKMAGVEGLMLPSYEQAREEALELRREVKDRGCDVCK